MQYEMDFPGMDEAQVSDADTMLYLPILLGKLLNAGRSGHTATGY